MKIKEVVKKIQNLPILTKKVILFTIVIFIGFVLLFYWIKNISRNFSNFSKEKFEKQFNLPPKLQEDLKKIEIQSKTLEEEFQGISKEELYEDFEKFK